MGVAQDGTTGNPVCIQIRAPTEADLECVPKAGMDLGRQRMAAMVRSAAHAQVPTTREGQPATEAHVTKLLDGPGIVAWSTTHRMKTLQTLLGPLAARHWKAFGQRWQHQ